MSGLIECFKDKRYEKQESNLKNGKDVNEMIESTIRYFSNSIKCENYKEDNFSEFAYNLAVENLLVRGVCSGAYNNIDDKVVAVGGEHCKKIEIKMPQISVSHFCFENMDEFVYGKAIPSNKVLIRVGKDVEVRQSEKMKENCLKATFAEAYNSKKYKIVKDYLKQNAINEISYVYSNIMHEFEHIKQYAIMKECANGVTVTPYYTLIFIYAIMRVANCKINKNALKSIYTDLGYSYNILEVDARINTIEKLGKMYLDAKLSESCEQKILDALKLAIYEELSLVSYYGTNYNNLVKQQLDRTQKMFMHFYGKTGLGQQILDDYTNILKDDNSLEKIKIFDKNLMRYAEFVANEESSTKFGQIAQTAIECKIDEILLD